MSKKRLIIGFGIIAVLIIWSLISMYPDWLWFNHLGFSPVFLKMLFSKFGFGIIVWLILILLIYFNLLAAKHLNPGYSSGTYLKEREGYISPFGLSDRALNTLIIAFILILSLIIAVKSSDNWVLILRYLYQKPFHKLDPIFNKDIGFYVFSLPLYILIRNGLMLLIVVSGLITIGWYLKNGALQIEGDFSPVDGAPPAMPSIKITPNAKRHIIFLCGILLLFMAWGYYLKIFGLLYSTQGAAFGASYVDVYVRTWAYRVLIILSLAFGIVLIYNSFKMNMKFVLMSGTVWVASIVLLTFIIPPIVEKLIVKPNELARETPFIDHNIKYTRAAFNLNKIKAVDFDVSGKLSMEKLKKNDATIQNIRIWDERPLLQTYRQLESLRLYYDFNNVDVDRYMINNKYRQVMIAARELVASELPPQAYTWVNRHLIYTHGYGVTSNPVNEVTKEGLPRLIIKDLPPTFEPGMGIDRPEIYYGEKTDDYVLVKTKTKELDYAKGDKNVYTIYQGKGGVLIGSFIRRLLFSVEFLDPQILFTTYLTPESRIMYNRRILNRVNIIAPFLQYDRDPYIVISGGKLYWIIDAYTTSDMYPYSTRYLMPGSRRVVNYIRNSVKVVVNAYNGQVTYYTMTKKDPLLNTYEAIFPHLFKPFASMPDNLKKHIRYPRDLFKIQANVYTKYHMKDVQVFYNQEDLWQIPDEIYGDKRVEMEPYYIILKLPGEAKEQFFLMMPVTPSKKDNMIGWLAARCDQPDYGHLLVYKLPKEKLIYGPMQIEARIDQQTEISRELSLWDQRGSRVIRGNLLVIPVGNTFIYVEPVYLEAKQNDSGSAAPVQPQPRGFFTAPQNNSSGGTSMNTSSQDTASLPELKRVIVAYGDRLVMKRRLDDALKSILGEETNQEQAPPENTVMPMTNYSKNLRGMAATALEHYKKANDYLRQGDWAGYGRELKQLEDILVTISKKGK